MAIYRLLHGATFTAPEVICMITAYEKVMTILKMDRTDPLTEIIAQKIGEVVRAGERSKDTICEAVLTELGVGDSL